jgi:aconitate hydratase
LKKQGVLALTFKNKADYDLIDIDDLITLDGQATLVPHSELTATVKKANGTSVQLPLVHSYAQEQVAWFKAGSAMNAANQKTQVTV